MRFSLKKKKKKYPGPGKLPRTMWHCCHLVASVPSLPALCLHGPALPFPTSSSPQLPNPLRSGAQPERCQRRDPVFVFIHILKNASGTHFCIRESKMMLILVSPRRHVAKLLCRIPQAELLRLLVYAPALTPCQQTGGNLLIIVRKTEMVTKLKLRLFLSGLQQSEA